MLRMDREEIYILLGLDRNQSQADTRDA